MSESRESFPVLENTGTGAGEALASKQEGVAPGADNGLMGFAYKDNDGNLVLPQLDPEGRLPVTSEGAGVEHSAAGELAAGSGTMVDITGATITLPNDKLIREIKVNVSCFRDALFNVVALDDVTPTIIGRIRVGSGQYTFEWDGHKKEYTTGSSGTQVLKVQGQNQNTQSAMSAEISCVEAA